MFNLQVLTKFVCYRGANIALEVAHEEFCETTIGCPSPADAALWDAVFDTRSFRVHCTQDVAGVSLSGALVRTSSDV
jgi:glycerol-3-phosphate dehydrogenase (NAD+)